MARLNVIASWLRHRAENIIALMLGSMFFTFLIQIMFRYLLNLPLGWTVEYVALVWLWGILFGYAFVVRDSEVIRLDLLYCSVPKVIQRTMDVATGLVCAGIFAWSLPKAYDFVTFMAIEKTAYMQIRFDLVFAIYIPFSVAIIIRSLVTVWRALRGPVATIETAGANQND